MGSSVEFACLLLVVSTLGRMVSGGCSGKCCRSRDLSCLTTDWRMDRVYGTCYCDKGCVRTKDCCFDYFTECPGEGWTEELFWEGMSHERRDCLFIFAHTLTIWQRRKISQTLSRHYLHLSIWQKIKIGGGERLFSVPGRYWAAHHASISDGRERWICSEFIQNVWNCLHSIIFVICPEFFGL